jgi:hypothetical protein
MEKVKTYLEMATEQALMDAIAKGHTEKSELMAYMASSAFQSAVQNYMLLFKQVKEEVGA